MSSTFKHLPLLAACFLGSCMVGPDFRTPTNDLPATWEANRPPHSSDKDLRSWWNIFGDPQLNRLVSTSLNNNPDMKVALLRIREARKSSASPRHPCFPPQTPAPGGACPRTEVFAAPLPRTSPWARPPPGSWTSLAATGGPSKPPAPPSCPQKLPQGPCAQPCWRTSPRPTLTGLPPANSSASPGNNWKSNAAPSPLRKNATKRNSPPVWMWSRPPPPSPPRKAASRNWKHRWPPLKTSSPCCWEHIIPV